MNAKRGRPRKDAARQLRIEQYLKDYELDDLNESNDMSALKQLVDTEIKLDTLYKALEELDATVDTRKVNDLVRAIKELTTSAHTLQDDLGITKKRRQVESDDSVINYVEKLKADAKTFMERRLQKIVCQKCNMTLMKYYVFIKHRAEGETGAPASPKSLNAIANPPAPIKYHITIECPQCGDVLNTNDES